MSENDRKNWSSSQSLVESLLFLVQSHFVAEANPNVFDEKVKSPFLLVMYSQFMSVLPAMVELHILLINFNQIQLAGIEITISFPTGLSIQPMCFANLSFFSLPYHSHHSLIVSVPILMLKSPPSWLRRSPTLVGKHQMNPSLWVKTPKI